MRVSAVSNIAMIGMLASLMTAPATSAAGSDSQSSILARQLIIKLADGYDACSAQLQQSFQNILGEVRVQPLWGPDCGLRNTSALLTDESRIRAQFAFRTQRSLEQIQLPPLHAVFLIRYSADVAVDEAVRRMAQLDAVVAAQPNYVVRSSFSPSAAPAEATAQWAIGSALQTAWGLQRIQAREAWSLSQGKGVLVAVVDTGVDTRHPDMARNVWSNPGEIAGNGRDDDNNGFADDVNGWNFFDDNNEPQDLQGHGTHVAGTIAAAGNSQTDVIGVAPQARILPVKAFGPEYGSSFDLARAMVYSVQQGAEVINNSWGCSAASDPVLEDSVRYAYAMGAVVVFAAGNDAQSLQGCSPQNMLDPKPIVVGASTQTDRHAEFSNVGLQVDVSAPAEAVVSLNTGAGYAAADGSSMAAAHVSGLAALLLAHRPNLTNEDVRQLIRASAQDIDYPGFDPFSGAGRINALRALEFDESLRVALKAPLVVQGAPDAVRVEGVVAGLGISGYRLSYRDGSQPSAWIELKTARFEQNVDGVLGEFNPSQLASGTYLLRLEVELVSGEVVEELTSLDLNPPVLH